MKFMKEEFYPTPRGLLEAITAGIKWETVGSVLEPSAGKGDIVDYVCERMSLYHSKELDIDCIELDNELRCTLAGKNYRVVHDDFLTFQTMKQYNLIIMNPPFSNGASHLLKALEMQKYGGAVVCLLNAETLKNPFSNERTVLVQKLQELQADISFVQNAFVSAERPTGVEIAVVKVFIEAERRESLFYEEMKRKYYREADTPDLNEVASSDFVAATVAMYNREVEAGVKLIREYQALQPYIMNQFKETIYSNPLLTLKCGDKSDLSINTFVQMVRGKYWRELFNNPKFTGDMTSNLRREYSSQVDRLKDYDFSVYNIKCIQLEMSKNLIRGIEDCIIKLFDELSHQYSYYDTSKNIHYYNGWKTNKAWIINKKVILPQVNAYSNYFKDYNPDFHCKQKLEDIEKALNYLDGGRTTHLDLTSRLQEAVREGITKKIELKYFYLTFFKKGTAHIEFKDEELLKKFNIFGSQQKGWLPPSYGKRKYSEMSSEEQEIIREFDGGEIWYQKVLNQADYFIYDPKSSILQITESA